MSLQDIFATSLRRSFCTEVSKKSTTFAKTTWPKCDSTKVKTSHRVLDSVCHFELQKMSSSSFESSFTIMGAKCDEKIAIDFIKGAESATQNYPLVPVTVGPHAAEDYLPCAFRTHDEYKDVFICYLTADLIALSKVDTSYELHSFNNPIGTDLMTLIVNSPGVLVTLRNLPKDKKTDYIRYVIFKLMKFEKRK